MMNEGILPDSCCDTEAMAARMGLHIVRDATGPWLWPRVTLATWHPAGRRIVLFQRNLEWIASAASGLTEDWRWHEYRKWEELAIAHELYHFLSGDGDDSAATLFACRMLRAPFQPAELATWLARCAGRAKKSIMRVKAGPGAELKEVSDP
jgi:hypothetical protein